MTDIEIRRAAWDMLCQRLGRNPETSEEDETTTLRAAWKAMQAFAETSLATQRVKHEAEIAELRARCEVFEAKYVGSLARADVAEALLAEAREATKDVTVHLIAAVSLLEAYHERMAPTKRDGLFNTKISDYRKSIERGRTAAFIERTVK